jgi:hypothetical protein
MRDQRDHSLNDERERLWAEEKAACLERWLDAEAARIAGLPTLEERRAALAVYTREAFAVRLKTRIARIWADGTYRDLA